MGFRQCSGSSGCDLELLQPGQNRLFAYDADGLISHLAACDIGRAEELIRILPWAKGVIPFWKHFVFPHE
jgi:hypothetical protein